MTEIPFENPKIIKIRILELKKEFDWDSLKKRERKKKDEEEKNPLGLLPKQQNSTLKSHPATQKIHINREEDNLENNLSRVSVCKSCSPATRLERILCK